MEQEIEMIKATQRQMQTMLGEILNELRRGPGPPLQSASTESPTTSSWNAGMVFPAAQTSPPGSMSGKRLYTFLQQLITDSHPDILIRENRGSCHSGDHCSDLFTFLKFSLWSTTQCRYC